MKRPRLTFLVLVLAVILLCVGYFALPIRPAIAELTATRYLQRHYPQYELPPAELVSTGFHQYYYFEWVESYGVQSMRGPYTAYVELNGILPFLVQRSILWETRNGEPVPIDP